MMIRGYPARVHIEVVAKTMLVVPILIARWGFRRIEDFGRWGFWKCTALARRIGYDVPPW